MQKILVNFIKLKHSPCDDGCRNQDLPYQGFREPELYDHGFSVLPSPFLLETLVDTGTHADLFNM